MRQLRYLMGIGSLLLLGAAAEAQKAKPPEIPEVLADNPKLKQKVKIECEGQAVGELLAMLTRKTGVQLSADTGVADDKVVLFCRSRPLRETLTDLSVLFHDVWQHVKTREGEDRYVLRRTRFSSDYEQTLFKAANARLITKMEEQVKALEETPEQMAKRAEDDPIRKSLSDPQNRTATQVYQALTQEQRETLFTNRILNFPPAAIRPEMAGLLQNLYQESMNFAGRFRQRGGAQPPEEKLEDYARHGVQFAIHSCGGKVVPSIYVFGKSSMHGSLFADLDGRVQWLLPPHGDPYSKTPLLPTAALPPAAKTQEAQREKYWVDRLRKLAELSNMPVLADYYRSRPVNEIVETEKAEPGKDGTGKAKSDLAPAGSAALDALCRPEGYLWWTRPGGTLLFRKRDWYQQQRYEVPDRWLSETVKRMKAQNNLPTLADVLRARELTSQQILGLNGLYAGKGYSYSEIESAGASELLTFLNTEIGGQPQSPAGKSLQAGRTLDKVYANENVTALAGNEAFRTFLNAQSHPIPLSDIQFFHVDVWNQDRVPAPEDGFKEASVTLNWGMGSGIFGSHRISLPFALPDDRRDKTKIEVE